MGWPHAAALKLGFNLVGYGCTTCIGNSGPLPEEISQADREQPGGRSPCCRATETSRAEFTPTSRRDYLASPPLVVAYALAGRIDIDLGQGADRPATTCTSRTFGRLVRKSPTTCEARSISARCYWAYGDQVFNGADKWRALQVPEGDLYDWDDKSTYVEHPPYFEDIPASAGRRRTSPGARPRRAGRQHHHRPHLAGRVHQEGRARRQVPDRSRRRAERLQLVRCPARQPRGHDHGTFANVRSRTCSPPAPKAASRDRRRDKHLRRGHDVRGGRDAMRVMAGKEYGSGSSRKWAAKGPRLLGVRR